MKTLLKNLYNLLFKSGAAGRHINLLLREFELYWQRLSKGFDDSDTWCLATTNALWIVPRLERFMELRNGYPIGLSDQEWEEILNKILFAFKTIAKDDCTLTYKNDDQIKEGLELYAKYYLNLWW
jgi:hypothetical protein